MNIPKSDGLLSVVLPSEIPSSASSQQLFINQDQQDEEASDCPLLTPSPPPPAVQINNSLESAPIYRPLEGVPLEMITTPTLENINEEDGLNAFMNLVNSSCKPLHDEPSSRDPMVESSTSGSSSDTNEPVCAQLLTQLNTAYQHLAPDAQALFYNQENGGKPPLVGIQLVVPKSPKDYRFMKWNWPLIRKTCFWSLMSVLAGCTALVIGVLATMPKRCDPKVEWWQGNVFYEIFPASFQDSSKGGDGIGDLRGITMRLDYLKRLGVRGIRLNSIFPAPHYPEYYSDVSNMTDINVNLGTLKDFEKLVHEIHRRNMSLILDLLLYPYVKTLEGEEMATMINPNKTDKVIRERRALTKDSILEDVVLQSTQPGSIQKVQETLSMVSSTLEPFEEPRALPVSSDLIGNDHPISLAIKTWLGRGVDGFYLKGLERYVHENNFPSILSHWKSLLGPRKILICHLDALNAAMHFDSSRNAILTRIDLIDVALRVSNGTEDIKAQVESITKGILFEKASYPWVHWSIGGVDFRRIASSINVKNASMAVSLLALMLPGTPSIFYGDEKGILDCECEDHQDLAHLHNLAPMYWEKKDGLDDKFTSVGVTAWLPEASKPLETSLIDTIAEMIKLRSDTPPIYVKAIAKDNGIIANCDIRYTKDEIIVIERWYPRRNSYVFVANLGNESKSKDLSSLYYGGHVVVGPANRLKQDVFFKELNVPPGEAFIIKLDK
ncbi:PREDICTED: maltase A2-like isoform X1 [Polistes dominula]|uniref:Maltase A2-like isoform X1 n=2 Tax=Polistes dominula TaxID=743375 RepID=A0ABM1IRN3_POLDO|nr:PREDICTED: maltase A2-like isoform X1 [Polistes dominula]XP_015182869.1 PREDICTED: maltase A2-like isoform X1 [Polistes dominula]XP_015182870.1 PREDICTED: maltase A2-like isoform X1 [Polistes dominula]XP_015182871.1 PREDICTED: maltase A2-like isoform X1 [Polistes dominula]